MILAGHDRDPASGAALAELCQRYWYPLYAYARQRGQTHEAAEDAVQSFFEHFLEKRLAGHADGSRGRFRTFLLACFRNFQGQQYLAAQTLKRGGKVQTVSWDGLDAAERYRLEPAGGGDSAEKSYDRRFVRQLVERVLQRLRAEQSAGAGQARFDALKKFLIGNDSSQKEAATALGLTEDAFKTAVSRLRKRFREMFHEEVEQTVVTPADLQEEMRYLVILMAPE